MKSKFYSIAGIRLRADSEREIADSRLYEAFCAPEGGCDVRVAVREGPLPERAGRLVSHKDGRSFYVDGDRAVMFSSYPDWGGEKPYACREGTDDRIVLTVDYPDGLWDAMLFHALNLPELFAQRGFFMLHCSFVICRGEAVLFCAGKGVGKSTQAALWKKYRRAEIVNGDRALLGLSEDGLTAFGTPYCGSSEIALNRSAPVKAVVLIEQGPRNEICRCEGASAFIRILSQLSFEDYQKEKAVDFATGVCAGVPVYAMKCLPEESAVSLLEERLWKTGEAQPSR